MILRSQKGVAAIEFALILPLLLVLTFGIIEFGIFLYDKAVITNASREGARAGIVAVQDSEGNPSQMSTPDITAVVDNYLSTYLINLGGTPVHTVTVTHPGSDLVVTVNFTYDFLVFPDLTTLLGPGTFNGTKNLQGITVMRME